MMITDSPTFYVVKRQYPQAPERRYLVVSWALPNTVGHEDAGKALYAIAEAVCLIEGLRDTGMSSGRALSWDENVDEEDRRNYHLEISIES